MIKTTNRFQYKQDEYDEKRYKKLPDGFSRTDDEISMAKSLVISVILHPAFAFLVWGIIFVCALFGITFALFEKPKSNVQDIEFVLVDKEAEPINKKTPYRADMNSRAGGIHDPKKKVSMPSPKPQKVTRKSAPSPAPAKQAKKAVKQKQAESAPKSIIKELFKAVPAAIKPSMNPTPAYRPSARPSATPSAPKIAANPNSPFKVAVPKTNAPVGLSPSGGGSAYGTKKGTGSGGGGAGGMGTSPTLSPTKGSGSGSGRGTGGSGTAAGRGTGGGYGSSGNPGPGNPKGAPGIDAIKDPDWGPYMRELERRIKRNWDPPKGNESKRVVLLFKIGRDGRLLSIKTVKSSGLTSADQAAKSAVELTAPFKTLPPEFKGSSVDIEFTFDYNVFGTGYR